MSVHFTVNVTAVASRVLVPPRAKVRNNGTDPMYIGGLGVTADATATGGFQLAAGAFIDIVDEGDFYAVMAATKTATLTVLRA